MGLSAPVFGYNSIRSGFYSERPDDPKEGSLYAAYDVANTRLLVANAVNDWKDIVSRGLDSGTAALYGCGTLIHKHKIPLPERYCFNRPSSALGATALTTGGGIYNDASSPYSMYLQGGVTAGDNARVVIPYMFSPGGNLMDMSAIVHAFDPGDGDNRLIVGLKESGATSGLTGSSNLCFYYNGSAGVWRYWVSNSTGNISGNVADTNLGREIQAGDLLTCRLYRQEGVSDIDSYAFYVNGLRIRYGEGVAAIPDTGMYPLIGSYCNSGTSTAYSTMRIRTMMFDYIP